MDKTSLHYISRGNCKYCASVENFLLRFRLVIKAAFKHCCETGKREDVDYKTLEEASNWARFASAVYAVMPFDSHRQGVPRCPKPFEQMFVPLPPQADAFSFNFLH